MRRAQVFLRDDQQQSLRSIASCTGRKQSDLIRQGVDLMIEQEQNRVHDWKQALRNTKGLWKDREDMGEWQASIRRDLTLRHKSLFSK
ncbi:MAG: hypothetical protein L3J24_08975 [Xanthomonadales bacterium]|nr:hypothetical protein [Xanthomonadales bacterium]